MESRSLGGMTKRFKYKFIGFAYDWRWSKIAAKLPGRTDDEIKNHLNTHIKKKLAKMGIDPVTHDPITKDPTHPTSPHVHSTANHPEHDHYCSVNSEEAWVHNKETVRVLIFLSVNSEESLGSTRLDAVYKILKVVKSGVKKRNRQAGSEDKCW